MYRLCRGAGCGKLLAVFTVPCGVVKLLSNEGEWDVEVEFKGELQSGKRPRKYLPHLAGSTGRKYGFYSPARQRGSLAIEIERR